MRALVTGSGGFVGGHLVAHLEASGDEVVEWTGGSGSPDVREPNELASALGAGEFDAVYHLAAQSRVDLSWKHPADTLAVNAGGTANLIGALAAVGAQPRVLVMSSAEVYGIVDPATLPVTEQTPIGPRTPYGVSKMAAEQLALLAGSQAGIEVIACRPFNQIGPGQPPTFVAPSFAQQVVANERAGGGEIQVGNLEATRDFLDVRDAVGAYRSLIVAGEPGEIYNVASGIEVSVRGLLDELVARSTADQTVVVDEHRFRPNDLPRMFGSIDRLRDATGWAPSRTLGETLEDLLTEWRAQ